MSNQLARIVLVGDSLTQFSVRYPNGWALRLASRYERKADIVVRGFSGYTSQLLLKYLDSILASLSLPDSKEVDCVVLWIGANDAAHPPCIQHVPVEHYVQNVQRIVDVLKGHSTSRKYAKHVIVLGVPAVAPHAADRSLPQTRAYTEALLAQVQRADLVVDIGAKMLSRADWMDMLPDGLHFNEKGEQFVSEVVADALEQLGYSSAASEPMFLPLWRDALKMLPEQPQSP
jgi:lysophospholipase L1-like esterase